MSLTVALSKGKLLAGSERLFRRASLPFPEGEGRRLVVSTNGLRFLFVKDMDVPTYVEYGVADCGIAGRDVLLETASDVYEPLDLGFGRCSLVLAHPKAQPFAYASTSTVRVATKYPRVAAAFFLERGLSAEVVKLAGSVEIAPGLGLADCIVDVVETGRTLAENGLEAVEDVAASSARLIVNRASFHARREEVGRLIAALRQATEAAAEKAAS
jgi:ATP phosphoribosyltransferase